MALDEGQVKGEVDDDTRNKRKEGRGEKGQTRGKEGIRDEMKGKRKVYHE